MRVGDTNGTAPKELAEPLFLHLNKMVGQRKVDYGSFLHTGIQHEHSPRAVFTHQYVYIDSLTPIEGCLFTGGGD